MNPDTIDSTRGGKRAMTEYDACGASIFNDV
jgi:hypothetical protein